MPLLQTDDNLSTNLLGDSYPYWWIEDDGVHWARFADEAMEQFPASSRRIDPVAVLSILSFEYICLDRTIVDGVSRLPWLGAINGEGVLRFAEAPHHGDRVASAEEIADGLYERYRKELLNYVEGYDRVYVLLSGGMDSRVMAGTLRQLEREGRIDVPIEAVTWGVKECRDVAYAQQLAAHFGWPWHHAPLTSETYWKNFEFGALALGAEVDPKHLHRMDWFEDVPENSVVLAASYGDSVGRAEFSSRHLSDITPLEPHDRSRLLRHEVYREAKDALQSDIRAIRFRHGSRTNRGWLELERQSHYMRRHLCTVMNVINRWADLKQSFVSPGLYGYIWSFAPASRTDAVYTALLERLDDSLLDVPWARTGLRYDDPDGIADRLPKGFHRYGFWLRRDHADKIHRLLFNGTLARLNIFDMDQVRWMFDEWQRETPEHDTSLCTQLSILASISLFSQKHRLQPLRLQWLTSPIPIKHIAAKQLARSSQSIRRLTRDWRIKYLSL